MAQQTSVSSLLDMTSSSNVVFLGEAGSGKSEIALNFAQALAELGGKPVHFFDLDMTKPLFRSRDRREALEALGVEILTCGTCLNHYGIADKLRVGQVTNMYVIAEKQMNATLVIRP